ncbi:MAG: hypothetical protein HOA84_00395 [Candidatus Jacksonbacteria bacterium]|jgi:hypothetical protein|nr:hypothetical protein [Candidatus Jacksonbacteria bacterium]
MNESRGTKFYAAMLVISVALVFSMFLGLVSTDEAATAKLVVLSLDPQKIDHVGSDGQTPLLRVVNCEPSTIKFELAHRLLSAKADPNFELPESIRLYPGDTIISMTKRKSKEAWGRGDGKPLFDALIDHMERSKATTSEAQLPNS